MIPSPLPASAHTTVPWRIHEIAPDFQLEDVWALPSGGRDDFPRLVELVAAADPARGGGCRGQMAVLVKPNGLVGRAYLAAIKPFRRLVVYPALLRDLDRRWASDP